MFPQLRLWVFVILVLVATTARAQIVTSFPSFPTMDDNITLTYYADRGSGGLNNLADTVYGHFGLVVAGPTSTSWTRTVGIWGTRDARTRMTRTAPNRWEITFNPRVYFGNVPTTVTGYRLAMVFRNASGNLEGKTETGGDIFLDLYQPGQRAMRISNPTTRTFLLGLNVVQGIFVETSSQATISLLDNGVVVGTSTGTSLSRNYSSPIGGNHVLTLTADFGGGTVLRDSITAIVVGRPKTRSLPAGVKDGPNYPSPTSAILVVAAPGKKSAFIRGDFNNWGFDTAYYMNRTPDSTRFWLQIDNLTAGQEYVYQYTFDGTTTVGDPLCEKTSDPSDGSISPVIYPNLLRYPSGKATGIASVLQPGRPTYVWRHPKPAPIAKEKMTIYEMHIRDFFALASTRSYKSLMDTVMYFKKLGVTAIELMPVSEFENNDSWGYNVIFHGAVDKAYGPQEALKAAIDSIHGQGMQVIIDVVYNHAFGQSPLVNMYPINNSPYCNAVPKHDFNVGVDLNHESEFTRAYMDRCNQRWLEDYRVDGFRFDLSKGFTQRNTLGNTGLWGQLDRSRVRNLARIATVCRASDPNAILILEHLGDNSEERILADSLGFMLWGNMTGSANNIMKGSGGNDLYGGYFAGRGWQNPNLVTYYESHDEERNLYEALNFGVTLPSYNLRQLPNALNRAKALASILLAQPGPKMLWQFQELGYDLSINRCPNGTINPNCRTDAKPARWQYYTDTERNKLYQVWKIMLGLRATNPVFSVRTNTLVLNGTSQKRVTLRGGANGDISVIANFGTAPVNQIVGFTSVGKWYEMWSGDSINVTAINQTVPMLPGETRMYSTKKLASVTPGILTEIEDELPRNVRGSFSLVPNPATSSFRVEGSVGTITCRLLGMDGRVISTQILADGNRTFDMIGTKPMAGIYLLQVAEKDGKLTHLRLAID